jgi:hypothetical protein
MKYTKEQRKEIADAFSWAKVFLNDDNYSPFKEDFICFSINRACVANVMFPSTASTIKSIISSRLGSYHTVVDFLCNTLKINEEEISYEDLQTYRHRWLDSLIEEFSK